VGVRGGRAIVSLVAAVAVAVALAHCGTRTGLDLLGAGSGGGGASSGTLPGADEDGGVLTDAQGTIVLPDGRVIERPDGCVDTTSDPANCGACGHDCQGGGCTGGICQPVLLTDQEFFPNTLALDEKNVYWANETDVDYGSPPASIVVRSMPKRGGAPRTLDTLRPGVPTSLHRDGNFLYFYRSISWTVTGVAYEGSIVRMCTDASCPRVSLVGHIDNDPWQIALDASRIYFPTATTAGVSQIARGGGVPAGIFPYPTFFFTRLAVDEAFLYLFVVPSITAAQNQPVMVLRAAKDAPASPAPLMKGLVEGGDVQVDAKAVFISDTRHVFRLPKSGPAALQPVAITPDGKQPGLFAMDDASVYWLEFSNPSTHAPSTLNWARKDGTGGGSVVLPNDATQAPGVVVDDTSVYWATVLAKLTPPTPPRGGIMKWVKPP
jgi:hypothetical protein